MISLSFSLYTVKIDKRERKQKKKVATLTLGLCHFWVFLIDCFLRGITQYM